MEPRLDPPDLTICPSCWERDSDEPFPEDAYLASCWSCIVDGLIDKDERRNDAEWLERRGA